MFAIAVSFGAVCRRRLTVSAGEGWGGAADGRPSTEYPDLLDEKAHALLHLVTTGEPVDAPYYHDGLPWDPAVTCWCRSCLASRIDGIPVTRYQYALHDPKAEMGPPGAPTGPPAGWDWEPGDPFMVED